MSPSGTPSIELGNRRRAGGLSFALRACVGAAALAVALPSAYASAEPPQALPSSVEGEDGKWQPALDYDGDGCYSSPAVDQAGNIAEGLEPTGGLSENCHDPADLDNTNAYARSKCNNGWCAYLYDLYFEKDQSGPISGHKHDLEHIVVWVNEGQPKYVSASGHGEYETKPQSEIPFEGDHAKIVYHKDGVGTHRFRHAGADEEPENDGGKWQLPALVSWNKFPDGVRDKLLEADFGSATLGITDKDGKFVSELEKALPEGIPFDPHG